MWRVTIAGLTSRRQKLSMHADTPIAVKPIAKPTVEPARAQFATSPPAPAAAAPSHGVAPAGRAQPTDAAPPDRQPDRLEVPAGAPSTAAGAAQSARPAAERRFELIDRPAQLSANYWTSLRYLSLGRLALAFVLALVVPVMGSHIDSIAAPQLFRVVALTYLSWAAVVAASTSWLRTRFDAQLVVQTVVDLAALGALVYAAGGTRNGFAPLLLIPIVFSAVLARPIVAISFAAAGTLTLLGITVEQGLRIGFDSHELLNAGIIGAGAFVSAVLVNSLANRLARQEMLAQSRGEDLRRQLAINQLVIAELPSGVVVFGRDARVRMLNRAAHQLLGLPGGAQGVTSDGQAIAGPARHSAGWHALGQAFNVWVDAGGLSGEAAEIGWPIQDQLAKVHGRSRCRVRFLTATDQPAADVIAVLEDLDQLEERAQQLKLASMGRLSASIAHEVRNPLGAISHASQLLAERSHDPMIKRLTAIVEDNSLRINRIIEDVLAIARRDRANTEPIDMTSYLQEFLTEFVAHNKIDAARVRLLVESTAPMLFDGEHLRQVLVNLLSNALRYASNDKDAVCIFWRANEGNRLELIIADDGPGLPADVENHIFEPFVTTEARGTGLGLYLARELCGSNSARIRYQRLQGGAYRSAFVIEPRSPGRNA